MSEKYDDGNCRTFTQCLNFLSIVLFAFGFLFIGFASYYLERDRRLRKELEKEKQH